LSDLAIVTSCDERYAPLAKGLILSLRALGFPYEGQQLCLLDIGCSKVTIDWMHSQGVTVVPLDAPKHIPFPTDHLPSFIKAMAFRPFMREVFQRFKTYLWIDSDTWVQQADAILAYQTLAELPQFDIAITPLIDINYKLHFTAKQFHQDLDRVYRAIYPDVGAELAWFPVLSAGVFAMRHNSRLWEAWGNDLVQVYQRDYRNTPDALHLAEQTALNRVTYLLGNPAYLDATHNYHLCAGPAKWSNDRLVIPYSQRTIGIAHLCAFKANAQTYLRGMALYNRGRYLGELELAALNALSASHSASKETP
jgi:glycosidase